MQEVIADKELSDAVHTTEAAGVDNATSMQSDSLPVEVGDTASDEEHDAETPEKNKRTYKKKGGEHLRMDGPVAGLCSLERGAAYVGLTKIALRAAIQRNQMPGHKTRSNPENEGSDGTWWFNAKKWDELADELPELEPPEWHRWKDYWTYDRGSKKFQRVKKEDCLKVDGRRVYKTRKSKLEQANNS
ncbi:transcriptional regulator [Salmonella enterica subsp. enterica serovar Poona]|nr:transcriptional regulator [Salmonella enterica subsp. enterica serovar Poona]EHZ8147782.1 transcriptional regulator [Salmonella enterica]EHZ8201581.1 transcriptional regulator [Salmonella enterica]